MDLSAQDIDLRAHLSVSILTDKFSITREGVLSLQVLLKAESKYTVIYLFTFTQFGIFHQSPMSFLEGGTNATIINSVIQNIGRDAIIFRFDGGKRGHC
jgi:hypothetical protein